jgi:hypothetical protein
MIGNSTCGTWARPTFDQQALQNSLFPRCLTAYAVCIARKNAIEQTNRASSKITVLVFADTELVMQTPVDAIF